MKFTYDAYTALLHLLRENGYAFTDYFSYAAFSRCAILRHDIDFSIEKAVRFSELEKEEGVRSIYFVLLKTDFYNPFTTENVRKLRRIRENGGTIGLHFDESQYADRLSPLLEAGAEKEYYTELCELIRAEQALLQELLGEEVRAVSMHCPSQAFLKRDLEFPGIVNAYGKTFFRDFKYLSDSSMHWRENVTQIVSDPRDQGFPRLHILTHAFWYTEKEYTLRERLLRFCLDANGERYEDLRENFNGLENVLRSEEVLNYANSK